MAIVRANEAIVLDDSDEVTLDLGDLILCEMGQMVHKLRVLSGMDRPVVDLGDGVEITIEEQDSAQPWRDRLAGVQEAVRAAVESNPGLDPVEVCKAILLADGWSWTAVTFRTPMWMFDHDEVLRPVVAREFEVLEWLDVSSSATR